MSTIWTVLITLLCVIQAFGMYWAWEATSIARKFGGGWCAASVTLVVFWPLVYLIERFSEVE